MNAVRSVFPDLSVKTSEPALAEGNLEAAHVTLTGTHQGDFTGVPATGKPVEFSGIDIIRVEDGKVAEHWGTDRHAEPHAAYRSRAEVGELRGT